MMEWKGFEWEGDSLRIASLHGLQKPLKQAMGEACRKVRVRRCDRF